VDFYATVEVAACKPLQPTRARRTDNASRRGAARAADRRR